MSMFFRGSFFILMTSLYLLSCKRDNTDNDSKDYYSFYQLEEKGWKSKSYVHYIDGIEYKATLVPVEYYVLKNEPGLAINSLDSIHQLYKYERVIEMEFKHASDEDLFNKKYTHQGYAESIKYMAFKIDKDFKLLTTSLDTILCAGAIYERNFKLAPFKRVLLHFSGVPENEDVQLLYNDRSLGKGEMSFTFNEDPIVL